MFPLHGQIAQISTSPTFALLYFSSLINNQNPSFSRTPKLIPNLFFLPNCKYYTITAHKLLAAYTIKTNTRWANSFTYKSSHRASGSTLLVPYLDYKAKMDSEVEKHGPERQTGVVIGEAELSML